MSSRSAIPAAVGFSAAVAVVTYLGCSGPALPPASAVGPVATVQRDIKATAVALADTTKTIKANATEGQAATPPAAKPKLDPYWTNIATAATKQEVLVDQLKAKDGELERIKTIANGWVKYSEGQKSRADKAEASLSDAMTARLHLLVVVGVVGLAVSLALMFAGNKIGLIGGVGCAALVAVSLFVAKLAPLLPWIIGGAVVVGLSLIVWQMIDKRRKFNVASTAATELVRTVEAAKVLMPKDARLRLFGDGPLPGKANGIQSTATKKLVLRARAELPNLAVPVGPETNAGTPSASPKRDSRGRFVRAKEEQPEPVATMPEEAITPVVD